MEAVKNKIYNQRGWMKVKGGSGQMFVIQLGKWNTKE